MGGEPAPADGAKRDITGYACVLASAICFALAGVLIKSIDWNPLSISGGRSVFAAAVLYALLRVRGRRLVLNGPTALGALINFVMLQTFVVANKMTTAANAIVLQFTLPVWVIVILWALTRQRPSRAAVGACAVIAAGIVCFFFEDLGGGNLAGDVIAVVSGVAYAGVFLLKRMPGCDFDSAAILSFAACAVCGVPTLLHESDFGVATVLAVAALGMVQVGLAYAFLSRGLDTVDPVAAALISTIEPILNPILVALVVGEMIGPLSLFGAVLVIGGALAYNVHAARE